MDTFFYCGSKEDSEETPKQCGYGVGFSPEVNAYFKKPCDSWQPQFFPKIEDLVKEP